MMKSTTRPQAQARSFYVTCHFAERSTTIRTKVAGSSTLPEVRSRIATELAHHLRLQETDVEAAGIVIASDDEGFSPYDSVDEATVLSDVVGDETGIHAIVPSKISSDGLDAGVPTSIISETPSFLSDPLISSWNARMTASLAKLKAELIEEQKDREAKLKLELEAKLTAVLAELENEKKLRVSAENSYRQLLEGRTH